MGDTVQFQMDHIKVVLMGDYIKIDCITWIILTVVDVCCITKPLKCLPVCNWVFSLLPEYHVQHSNAKENISDTVPFSFTVPLHVSSYTHRLSYPVFYYLQ